MLDRTEVGQSVDVLAEILDTVHVQTAEAQVLPAELSLSSDGLDSCSVVIFVVRAGRLVCGLGGEQLELVEGDALALLRAAERLNLDVGGAAPQRERHSGFDLSHCAIGPAPDGNWPAIEGAMSSASGGGASVLRCTCHFADAEKNPLLGALPRWVYVPRHQWADANWLQPTVAWIEREATSQHPGAPVVVHRLIELLWVQLVRSHVATTPIATHGWLRALSDAQIGGALSLIHEKPDTVFTVAGLAQSVGMSRSAFASQFTRLVGEPPLHYVARWRMLKASQLLKEDRQTLAEVANAVGYESEAAFSKAFKRWSGQAPGSYRRDRRSEPAAAARLLAG